MSWLRQAPSGLYVTLAFVFIYLPVVVLVLFSFQDGLLPVPPFQGPSLQWYERMFDNRRLMEALLNSLVVATLSSIVTTLLGFLAAHTLARKDIRFAGGARYLLMAPITVSYLIIGMGLLITFNLLGISRSLFAVGIGHVIINLPLCFAIIFSQMGIIKRTLSEPPTILAPPICKPLF